MVGVEGKNTDRLTTTTALAISLFHALIAGITMTHDSYHCGQFRLGQVLPFPTQREVTSYNFVGAQVPKFAPFYWTW